MDFKVVTDFFKGAITFISKVKLATLLFILLLAVLIFGFKIGVLQDLKDTNINVEFASIFKKEDKTKSELKANKTSLNITDVRVTPAKFNIPSYLYFKVKNDGVHDANNINVDIDLGTSSVVYKDVRQSGCDFISNKSESLIELKCDAIHKDQYIDVYLLITLPTFNSIIANGDNVISIDKYIPSNNSNEESIKNHDELLHNFIGFLYCLAAFVIVVVTLTIMGIIGGWLFPNNEDTK